MGGVMTNKEILELAEKYFDYQGGWIAYSKEDLLKFAQEIYKKAYSTGHRDGFDDGWEGYQVSTEMNTWSSDDD
jgi:flagellar biosynthesis/type III secretory pathway protein FliH